ITRIPRAHQFRVNSIRAKYCNMVMMFGRISPKTILLQHRHAQNKRRGFLQK
ncbi:hypothetical protein E2562_029442, partial [Oryza meyeriana var. granulata]